MLGVAEGRKMLPAGAANPEAGAKPGAVSAIFGTPCWTTMFCPGRVTIEAGVMLSCGTIIVAAGAGCG